MGPLVGALSRSLTGWVSDRWGGGRVTLWVFVAMALGTVGVLYFLNERSFAGFFTMFLLLFFAFKVGMPPGLASVSQQVQAFFTVLLAACFLRDRPKPQQITGMIAAFGGLALIGLTLGGDLRPMALGLALVGALSWAIGNVLVKHVRHVPTFPLVVWASLVPPLPALAVAYFIDQGSLLQTIAGASWVSIGATLYLGAAATVVGYALWGSLLQRHATGAVAPFALVAPCVGVVSSAWLFGEGFPPLRLAGMGLIIAGLAVAVLPAGWLSLIRWPCRPSSAWPRDR